MKPFNPQLRWRLDGGNPQGPRVHWPPTHGKHTFALISHQGKIVGQVTFSVRGAPLFSLTHRKKFR